MKGKKVLEFLILKPAFTSRNLSSLGFVVIFFFVYWLAGGKVIVPNVKQGSNFGSVTKLNKNSTPENLGTTRVVNNVNLPSHAENNLSQEASSATTATINDQSKQLEEKLQQLNQLEERLKSLKRAKSANTGTGGE